MRPSEWPCLLEAMRRDCYGQQQRSKWIEEALLMYCAFWPALSSYSAAPDARPYDAPWKIKVTVHPLIDILIAWKFFRPNLAPRRLAYSRVVASAICLRASLGFRLRSRPGSLVDQFLDVDVEPHFWIDQFGSQCGRTWMESCARRLFIQRSMHLFAVLNAPPSEANADDCNISTTFPVTQRAAFYQNAIERLRNLGHKRNGIPWR